MRVSYVYPDGTSPLLLQVFLDGKRKRFPLEIKVLPKQWDAQNMRIRKNHSDYTDLNLIIANALAKASEIAVQCRLKNEHISFKTFERRYFKDQSQSFLNYWAEKMDRMKPQLAEGTYKHHKAVLKKLTAYSPETSFGDLNLEFINGFDRFLRKEYGNSYNTRMTNMNKVRRYINLAIAEGHMDKNPFDHYQISFQESRRTVLNRKKVAELVNLWDKNTFKGGHHIALQNFLLGCFTGLRIGDVYLVRKSMIDGNWLIFKPKKSLSRNKEIEIPLSNMARKFIASGGDMLAERLSEQKTNEYLKDIAAYADIKQRLTFHAARHTFASIYLELGGSVEVLKEILGHSKIATTMKYVHINRRRKESEIGLFDKDKWHGEGE